MTKFILTVIVGIIVGQLMLLIVGLAPDAIKDVESYYAMVIVGPIISLMTMYGHKVYEIVVER